MNTIGTTEMQEGDVPRPTPPWREGEGVPPPVNPEARRAAEEQAERMEYGMKAYLVLMGRLRTKHSAALEAVLAEIPGSLEEMSEVPAPILPIRNAVDAYRSAANATGASQGEQPTNGTSGGIDWDKVEVHDELLNRLLQPQTPSAPATTEMA